MDAIGGFIMIEWYDSSDESCDNAVNQLTLDGLDTEMVNDVESIAMIIRLRELNASFLVLSSLDGTMTEDDESTFIVEGMEFNDTIDAFIEAHS